VLLLERRTYTGLLRNLQGSSHAGSRGEVKLVLHGIEFDRARSSCRAMTYISTGVLDHASVVVDENAWGILRGVYSEPLSKGIEFDYWRCILMNKYI